MSYNVANFDEVARSDGVQGTVQVSDGNLGFEGANGVTINSLGDITANAFFGFTTGGGGGGGTTPSLQSVTTVGATTDRAVTVSNSLTVTGNLFVTGNVVSIDTENLVVQDPIVQLANNSTSDLSDTGIVFTRPTSNVVIGWRGDEDEVMVGFSTSSADGTDLTPLNDNKLNLKVYGNVEATGLFLGNANLLSNIVNSDVGPATYGNTTHVTQITVSNTGRITTISNVEIQERSNLDQVVNRSNVTSNTLEVGGLYSTGNIQTGNYFLGNANLLSNIVNSDIGPATYGNTTHVTQITISDTGRITGVSNVEIQERSNLDQVVNRGNVTSNIVTFGGVVSTGNIEATDFLFDSTTSVLTIDSGNGGYIARSLQYIKFTENVSKGHPIYISGVEGDHLLGSKADETDSTKMPAIGLASDEYSTNDFGYVVRLGELLSVSESAVFTGTTPTANKTVYVGSSGNLTVDRPTGSLDLIQNIGIISKVTGNSVNILVQGAGRANDVPNRIITNDANIHQTVTIGGGNIRPNTNLYVTGNVYADIYEGDGGLLSNIINNTDVGPATYGNTTHIAQITVSDTGKITGISNVEIQELSNLDQVVNRGNVTSNTLLLNGIPAMLVNSNIYFNRSIDLHSLNQTDSISIGWEAGSKQIETVSIGNRAGYSFQKTGAIAIGKSAGGIYQSNNAIAIGYNAATYQQGSNTIAIGSYAGYNDFLPHSSIVLNATGVAYNPPNVPYATYIKPIRVDTSETSNLLGYTTNGEILDRGVLHSNLEQVVNTGNVTSNTVQLTNTDVSLLTHGEIRYESNIKISSNLDASTIDIGYLAGSEGPESVSIGFRAGSTSQGSRSVSIGRWSGNSNQSDNSVAVGGNTGRVSQGTKSVALGYDSGVTRQGDYSIAIGNKAGYTDQNNYSIVLNATQTALNTSNENALYIKPIRVDSNVTSNILGYTDEGEIIDRGVLHSNLDQILTVGNVSSSNITIGGQANVANIYISQAVGAGPTVSSNIITVDQAGHTYKFFRIPAYPTGSLEGITIQNTTDGCQTLVDIHPIGGDLDVFENFSNGGSGPTVLTSLQSNLVINTGNHVMISCVTDLSNTFVNIIGFY